MTRIAIVATDPLTAERLMDGQLAYLQSHGFEVTVITAPGPLLDKVAEREGVHALAVPMQREISIIGDLVSLFRLTVALRRLQPEIVSAGTPKGGLLGTIAARLSGVPMTVYHLRGLRFETERGLKRRILVGTERIAAACAHRVLCNGESLRQRFVELGFAPTEKTWVPAHGTSNGVEVERFSGSSGDALWARAERQRVGFEPGALVVGFVGRFTRDKGVEELAEAFRRASKEYPELRLLLVGDFDTTDPVDTSVVQSLRADQRVVITGYLAEPARHYGMMDLFAFPSHREGFPDAPLEAAASGLPVLGFRATGTVDAVVHGTTGVLVEVGDVAAFTKAILAYARDPELRARHGAAGRQRVSDLFRREIVWAALADGYSQLSSSRR